MPSIEPILIEAADAMTRELLEATKRRIGRPSNMRRTMAHSPSVLEAYLHINHVYEQTRISTRVRGLITAAIAQALGGDYIFSVAVELAAFEEARRCESNDPKIAPPLSNPGCMLQLQAGVRSRGKNQRVVHVVELLDEAYAAA